MKKNHPPDQDDKSLDLFFDSLVDSVSDTIEHAEEYLESEGIEYQLLEKEGWKRFQEIKAKILLAQGLAKQKSFSRKRKAFEELLKNQPELLHKYRQETGARVSFRNLKNLDKAEIDKLFEDADFLIFLEESQENEFPSE